MIVLSASLAASLTQDQKNLPIVGYNNIVTFNTVSADTEDGLYPASNLANPSTVLR